MWNWYLLEIRPWSNFFPTFLCGLLVSCPYTTCPHRTFSHGTCPHTTYPHTTYLQTIQLTYNLLTHNSTHTTLLPLLLIHITCHHTTCHHTTYSLTTLLTDLVDLSSHNCSTHKPCRLVITQLAHRQQLQNLLTHNNLLTHRSSLCVTGIARMALGWLRWRAWAGVAGVTAATVGVAGMALWYINLVFSALLFPWQAWYLVASIFSLYGRSDRYGIGLAPVARLGRSGCRGCWRGRRGTLVLWDIN